MLQFHYFDKIDTTESPTLHDPKVGTMLRAILCVLAAAIFSCGNPGRGKETVAEGKPKEVIVDWYSIPDAGLLSIEKQGEDSIAFTLKVEQGERCVGRAFGTAYKQKNGTYVYGDSDCTITFRIDGTGVTIDESGDLCDHGAHCSFDGNYSKVTSQLISPANADLMSLMPINANEFSCLLREKYGYTSDKYPCGKEDTVQYHPAKPSWYEGPVFPQEKVGDVHPSIEKISVEFEHGSLRTLTVTLKERMILQDVQRIFSLSDAFDNYGHEEYSDIMALTFDEHDVAEKLNFSINPVFVKSFTLTGFEHMGTGDMEEASETIVEAVTTYKYKENGNTYTLVNEDGPGPYEFTCKIATLKTSSDLAPQGKSSYAAANMTDMDESTTWAEGKSGLGIGEWVEFTITDRYKEWGYTGEDFIANHFFGDFMIQIGYAKSPALWKKNARPIRLKSYLNSEVISIIQLRDSPDFQRFNIFRDRERIQLKVGDAIRFEIIDVVQGSQDEDACISEFHLEANCG